MTRHPFLILWTVLMAALLIFGVACDTPSGPSESGLSSSGSGVHLSSDVPSGSSWAVISLPSWSEPDPSDSEEPSDISGTEPVSLPPVSSEDSESGKTSSEPAQSSPVSGEHSKTEPSKPDEKSSDEPDVSVPPLEKTVSLGDGISVMLPKEWTYTQTDKYLIDASNPAMSQHLTAEKTSLDNPKGLTDDIITEGMLSSVRNAFPSSQGYSVSTGSVSTGSGKHPVITIVKSGSSEPYRQQAYFLKGKNVYIVTVFAERSSNASVLWKFVRP